MRYPIALIIGRFQPFHLGHLYLVRKALEVADKIIIGIGSASIFDENNPISYEERKIMLEKVIKFEGLKDRVIKIVPLEDFFDDKKWLKNVKKKAGKFDVVVSNNDWTNSIMEKAGYKVKRFPYYKRNIYGGWRIRKLIRLGQHWENRTPNYLLDFLTSHQSLVTSHFNHIVIGGTFDHFHKGHEEFIETAFKYGKKATIGIATEKLYKDKFLSQTIEPFKTRKKSVSEFLEKNKWFSRPSIISFSKFTGGADKNKDIDAIVASRLTYPNALKINQLREKNDLPLLRIIIVKEVLSEDGELLSSERIRAGKIDRKGKSYWLFVNSYLEKGKTELLLPENLREELRKPFGKVFDSVHKVIKFIKFKKPIQIIAVGDIIVDSLIKNGIEPDVKVIDFRSRRIPLKRTDPFRDRSKKGLSLKNKPGTINLKTAERLNKLIKIQIYKSKPHTGGGGWFVINGEEDLLTLPAILFAPLGSLVFYGHWQLGVIGVEVTEKSRERVKSLLNRFKI